VYSRLVDSVNKALPTFHRYLALRKKMLGVDQLHYYDLYAPLVASVDPLTLTMQKMNHVMDEMEKILANTPAK
jgi:oligoendopeptidase F